MIDRQWIIVAGAVAATALAIYLLLWLPLIVTSWHWWML